jgi:hypothetical protein
MAKYSIDSDRVVWRRVGEELVVVDIESGTYYMLEGPAQEIWEVIAGGGSLEDAVERVAAEFEVGRAQAEKDALEFIGELKAEGLIA